VLIAQLREHLAAADARYAALRADLAATTPWYVDIQPKNAGPRARKRLIVVAKDMQRATTKATGYAQGADVLAIAANTELVAKSKSHAARYFKPDRVGVLGQPVLENLA
jgi:hypothetical protein